MGCKWWRCIIGEYNWQIARRLTMVGSRGSWVASGCVILLGNASAEC